MASLKMIGRLEFNEPVTPLVQQAFDDFLSALKAENKEVEGLGGGIKNPT